MDFTEAVAGLALSWALIYEDDLGNKIAEPQIRISLGGKATTTVSLSTADRIGSDLQLFVRVHRERLGK